MKRFFIDQSKIVRDQTLISGSDAKHMRNVLRLKPGDNVMLFDNAGLEYEARITAMSFNCAEVSVIRSFPKSAESPVQIIVAQGFLKEKKMDRLVRQMTELGIIQWVPFFADRSVPRPDEKRLAARTNRWNKIAREAIKQCTRSRPPEISSVLSFHRALDIGKACDLKIIFWENETNSPNFTFFSQDVKVYRTVFIMLGPEGGFTFREIETARSGGCVTAGLGPRILRAETAAVAACSLIQYFFGDMGEKKLDNDLKGV